MGAAAATGLLNIGAGQLPTVEGDYVYMCLCQENPTDAAGNPISPYDADPVCPQEPQASKCYIQRYKQYPDPTPAPPVPPVNLSAIPMPVPVPRPVPAQVIATTTAGNG